MVTLITILQIISCFLIVTLVLLQPAKGGGFMSGGNSQGVFGGAGATSVLFKGTMYLAGFLMISCLILSWNQIHQSKSSVVNLGTPITTSAPANSGAGAAPAKTETAPTETPSDK